MDRITVGNVEIIAISDGTAAVPAARLFPDNLDGVREQYHGLLDGDEAFRINFGCFLLRADGRTVLVDTGNGPEREGPLLQEIAAAGVKLEEIDFVVFTHLHGDHIGWNIERETGKARFPRARYLVPRADFDHYTAAETPSVARDIAPLAQLGALDLIEGEHAITASLTTLPAPGHTPGHMGIAVVSQGQHALVLGDAFVAPISVARPEWRLGADWDGAMGIATRRALSARIERDAAVVALSHAQPTSFGRFEAADGHQRWASIG